MAPCDNCSIWNFFLWFCTTILTLFDLQHPKKGRLINHVFVNIPYSQIIAEYHWKMLKNNWNYCLQNFEDETFLDLPRSCPWSVSTTNPGCMIREVAPSTLHSRATKWISSWELHVSNSKHRKWQYMTCKTCHIKKHIFWVNYNISLTWIKAIWGWFPLLTMISSEVAVRSL